jgi:hypothetical protein
MWFCLCFSCLLSNQLTNQPWLPTL